MRSVVVSVGLWAVVACTKPNPLACADGACSDPAFPFCDTQGTLGGRQNECIAVSCTPGEVAECRGSEAVVCNETGDNYEVQACVRGCEVDRGGCVVEPSNGLGKYLDQVPLADVTLDGAFINTITGDVTGALGLVTFLEPAPTNGLAIRVYVAERFILRNVTVGSGSGSVPALAFVAREEIIVDGEIRFAGGTADVAAGAVTVGPCVGHNPFALVDTSGQFKTVYGSGGGANATDGARGGTYTGDTRIPAGGTAQSNVGLEPLLGGCNGGDVAVGQSASGGGALQLTSLRAVRLTGRIDVHGEPGGWAVFQQVTWAGGGGAGGSVLLEAPQVEVGESGVIVASGGGGASYQTQGGQPPPSWAGSPCASTTNYDCTAGGNGGHIEAAMATAGEDFDHPIQTIKDAYMGAGGGAIGRVHINTTTGVFDASSDRLEAVVTVATTKR